jgi:four helix bundle protein
MKSYRDLEIYRESKALAIEIHKISKTFSLTDQYEEGSQVRRSSKAVTSLIVEGYGRKKYKAELIKYLVYALAECDETIVHLEFLKETDVLDKERYDDLSSRYDILSKRINKFTQWVKEKFDPV